MASELGLVDAEAAQELTTFEVPPVQFGEDDGKGGSNTGETVAAKAQHGKGGKKNKKKVREKKEKELADLLESVLAQF